MSQEDVKELKLVSLSIENFMRINAVEISPSGGLIQITGNNEQGKTSIFKGIWGALDGMANVQKMPIKDGQETAFIRLDLGTLKVTRTFKKDDSPKGWDSKLTVESEEGAKYPSPQAMLNSFLGALSFDPLAFSRMAVKDQFDTLKKFVPGVDFEKIEAENAADFSARTSHSRQARDCRAVEASLKDAPAEEPKKIDEKALTDRLANAAKKNQKINAEKYEREQRFKIQATDVLAKAKACEEEIADLSKKLKEAEKRFVDLNDQATKNADSLNSLPPLETPEDADLINKQLQEAKVVNESWSRWSKKAEMKRLADEQEAKVKELTAAMEARTAAKVKAIADAKLPVPGMTLGDGVVLLNNVPFEQASDAQKLIASVRMAMAANPKLKLILIQNGSLLDAKAMELLAKLAEETGYQVFIERVDGSGKVGFVIEDGRVKGA